MSNLPEQLTIPVQLIERWLAQKGESRPEVDLTRVDWDHLYTAFDKGLIAQARLRDAIVALSNGATVDATALIDENSRLLIESQNSWRRFFMAVMSSAGRGVDG